MLHEGKVKASWWRNKELRKLFLQVLLIALITAGLSALLASAAASFSSYAVTLESTLKIFAIAAIDALLLVCVLFVTSVYAGIYFFKKQEDPNNFLIPIATSVADFGNMVLLALLVVWFF